MATLVAEKGNYKFFDYGNSFYTVDYVTKSAGTTVIASDSYQEVKNYFDSLDARKRPQ